MVRSSLAICPAVTSAEYFSIETSATPSDEVDVCTTIIDDRPAVRASQWEGAGETAKRNQDRVGRKSRRGQTDTTSLADRAGFEPCLRVASPKIRSFFRLSQPSQGAHPL